MRAYATFDAFLAGQSPRDRAVIRKLRALVRRAAPALQETVKWGNGCWVKGERNVAFVHVEPDHVQFGFFYGATLQDPKGLLQGKGRYVRHVKLRAPSDVDARALATLLRQAAAPR